MASPSPQHVTIVGVGLLGGSVGLAIKSRYAGVTVAGVGRRQASLRRALARGAIDTAHLEAASPAARSDLVVLATPVGAFAEHLRAIRPVVADGAMVTDVGSTKAAVVRTAEQILGAGGPFVGSHPMAGSERKGVDHARADLFERATCILTPTAATPPALADRAEALWRALGMRTVRMAPADHDQALARVSHLPHVLAALLMMLPDADDLPLAATGLRDVTRLASGDPEMWRDVLVSNREAVVSALGAFGRSVRELDRLLSRGDPGAIEQFLRQAKQRRDATIGRARG
jgi:prephenate dehydrogenase